MMVFLLASYLVILAPVRLVQVYSVQLVLEAVARPRARRPQPHPDCPNGLGALLGGRIPPARGARLRGERDG